MPDYLIVFLPVAVILAAIVHALYKARTGHELLTDTSPSSPTHRTQRREVTSSTRIPPEPMGEPFEPWVRGDPIEVVGEHFRPDSFRALFGPNPDFYTYDGAESLGYADLVTDPYNPHGGGHAVSVWVAGCHVGFLERSESRAWFPTVQSIEERGEYLHVRARVWASERGDQVNARVTIYCPSPENFEPLNNLPDEHPAILPIGSECKVTRAHEHMDILAPWIGREPSHLAVTLHSHTETRPRSTVELIEVRLDGERVGVLTALQSERRLEIVRLVESRGHVPVARAILNRGGESTVHLSVHVATSDQVTLTESQD